MYLKFAERRARMRLGSQGGFTLIELLVVMAIGGILVTLGAFAIRQFWFVRALSGAQDQVTVQLRQLQQRVIAETHPLVYGARLTEGGDTMGLIRYDPETDKCVEYQTIDLGTAIIIATPTDIDSDTTVPYGKCRAGLVYSNDAPVPNASTSQFVFFFARGNGTPGQVTVRSTQLGRNESIRVEGVTGRITPL